MLRRETAGATKLEAVGPVNWNAPEFWVDGGCLGNNDAHGKREAYGSLSDGKTIMRRRFAKARTNNEAEYMTLLAALKNMLMNRTDLNGPTIFTDSQLMVGQLTQGSKVKATNLVALHDEAALLLATDRCYNFVPDDDNQPLWVPKQLHEEISPTLSRIRRWR